MSEINSFKEPEVGNKKISNKGITDDLKQNKQAAANVSFNFSAPVASSENKKGEEKQKSIL